MPDRWIVISLDAFANLALGAYGSSWNTTPNIDSIAASGITWDRAVVPFDDTVQTLRDCWSSPSDDAGQGNWLAQCLQHGRVELILGDDPAGRDQSQAIAQLAGEVGFDRCTVVEVHLGEEPSEEIESTAIAELFAALVERLQEVAEVEDSGDAASQPWSVLWLHSDLLARHWDAPRWLFPVDEAEEPTETSAELDDDEYEEEAVEEFEIEVGYAEPVSEDFRPPSYAFDLLPDPSFDPTLDEQADQAAGPPELVASVTPPSYRIPPDDHPDWIMTWMQTYGCQVRLIDQLIAMVAQAIKQLDQNIGLAVVGTSGFSFGQNGWIGHRAGPLRSPQIQVPAIVYDPSGPMLRWPRLASLSEVVQWVVPGRAAPSPEFWAGLSGVESRRDSTSTDEAAPEVHTRSDRATSAITTDQWFFVQDEAAARLYLKPDDRDDANDVADRCRDVVDEFLAKSRSRDGEAPAEPMVPAQTREGEAPAEPIVHRNSLAQQELRPPMAANPSLLAQQELRPPMAANTAAIPDTTANPTGRKRPAHGVYISPINPTIVYVTICCDKRRPWLATERHHSLLLDIWQDSSHWVVGRYVLMPDHLHLFAAPQENAVTLDAWIKYWKSQFTKRNMDSTCVWQTDHWDTRIRSLSHYEERSNYIFDNPVIAKLVEDAEAWPYKGVVHELRWE